MPFVNVRTVKGALSEAQRTELQERLIDLLVEIEGGGNARFRPYVWVLIEEHEPTQWNLGGIQPTPDMFKLVRQVT